MASLGKLTVFRGFEEISCDRDEVQNTGSDVKFNSDDFMQAHQSPGTTPQSSRPDRERSPDVMEPPKRQHRDKLEIPAAAPEIRCSPRIAEARTAAESRVAAPPAAATAAKPNHLNSASQEWEVERIVGSHIDPVTYEHFYEVKWKGFPSTENTWEPKKNLGGCRETIADFEGRNRRK